MKTKTLFIIVAATMLSFTNAHAQLEGRISTSNSVSTGDSEFQEMLQARKKTPEQIEQERQEQLRMEQERMERKAAKEAQKREKQAAKEQKKAEKAAQKAVQKAAKK